MVKQMTKKITDKQRKAILALKGKQSTRQVAKKYNVSNSVIWNIWNPTKTTKFYLNLLKKVGPLIKDKECFLDLTPEEQLFISELQKEE